jgi:hypothetical protein
MKKAFLFVMAALLLASSLAFISCGDGGSGGGGNNVFIGTWTTSRYINNSTHTDAPATVKITSSDWTLTVPTVGINESGKYSFSYESVNINLINLYQNGANVGQAAFSAGSMVFDCKGAIGQFTKQQ